VNNVLKVTLFKKINKKFNVNGGWHCIAGKTKLSNKRFRGKLSNKITGSKILTAKDKYIENLKSLRS
jgi:hypothetical protein